ncbi:MAG TPA: hypothetical protein V6D25_05910 [Leptolyngbyaceae cyanobacterium]
MKFTAQRLQGVPLLYIHIFNNFKPFATSLVCEVYTSEVFLIWFGGAA